MKPLNPLIYKASPKIWGGVFGERRTALVKFSIMYAVSCCLTIPAP